MKNFFEMIYEYQLLRGKQDRLDVPLDEDERARLVALSRLLTGEADGGRRTMPRAPVPARVVFTLPGGFESGEIKNISGTGIAIATARPPAQGTRIVVRVEDGGVEYLFPCRVVWRRLASNLGMGAIFDGVPSRASVFHTDETTGVWKRSIQIGGNVFGSTARRVQAA
ncbi:MAG: PilZ domain-containing protein [Sandaracinus sp.]